MNAFDFKFGSKISLRGPETVRKTHSSTSSSSTSSTSTSSRSSSSSGGGGSSSSSSSSSSTSSTSSSSSRRRRRSRITNRQPIAQPIAMQVLAIAQSRVNALIHKFVTCFYGRLSNKLGSCTMLHLVGRE